MCQKCHDKLVCDWTYMKLKDGCVEPQFDIIVEKLNEIIDAFNELKIKGVKFRRIDTF